VNLNFLEPSGHLGPVGGLKQQEVRFSRVCTRSVHVRCDGQSDTATGSFLRSFFPLCHCYWTNAACSSWSVTSTS